MKIASRTSITACRGRGRPRVGDFGRIRCHPQPDREGYYCCERRASGMESSGPARQARSGDSMNTRRFALRIAAAALLAAVLLGGAVAVFANHGSSSATPGPGGVSPGTTMADPKAGVVNPANFPKQSLWPADPSFTGGPPQQANTGTKPPASSAP